ncbi:MAG: M3 family oligoendopeptidase, partial [Parachlamydiales bacterium]|nr:M3 family oligoendopeptidase [Parachlamydiales bacterium]
FEELDIEVIKAILKNTHNEILDKKFGSRLKELFKIRVLSFDLKIKSLLETESALCTEFSDLLASAEITFNSQKYNLSSLAQFYSSHDRQIRYDARRAQSDFFEKNQTQIDAIFDALVKVRSEKAFILGYDSYIPLAYNLMKRLDYTAVDVDAFRQQIVKHVVPLALKMRQQQAVDLNISELMFWDEPVLDSQESPKPLGDSAFIIDRCSSMYNEFSKETANFFQSSIDRDLFDLDVRQHKVGGGYCISLDSYRAPFIFSNFNGTQSDVVVMTHECGHAFQYYMSRNQLINEYLWPTLEACEIHSMSMVFLTFPWMHLFFGKDADRYCQQHLKETIFDLCNICLVDEFQHEIFKNPNCNSADRRAIWKELESKYQPWRNYGDLSNWTVGNYWHVRDHIFLDPFYYIDYGLATVCALQIYEEARTDRNTAIKKYMKLCQLGGSMSFTDLLKAVNLDNPFKNDYLSEFLKNF